MSKPIRMTKELVSEICNEFLETISKSKIQDGKISYTKTLTYVNRKATLVFSEVAWMKMQMLIADFNSEVAWHGVARRDDDETLDRYIVDDIIVYPQEVTGATVNTDQEKYQTWLYEQEDEVFNNIRFQGHSHVNMQVNPSGVDTTHQAQILEQLTDDMFYIFVIWNKKGDKTVKIYDLKKNIFFDTHDVDVEIIDGEYGLASFIKNANDMVQPKTYKTPTVYNGGKAQGTDTGSKFVNNPNPPVLKTGADTPKNASTDKQGNGAKKGHKKGHKKNSGSYYKYDDYEGYDGYGYGYYGDNW